MEDVQHTGIVDFKNVTVTETAHKEELRACVILNKYLFDGKSVVVGDNSTENVPDIWTADRDLGVEVTTCEIKDVYKYLTGAKRILFPD